MPLKMAAIAGRVHHPLVQRKILPPSATECLHCNQLIDVSPRDRMATVRRPFWRQMDEKSPLAEVVPPFRGRSGRNTRYPDNAERRPGRARLARRTLRVVNASRLSLGPGPARAKRAKRLATHLMTKSSILRACKHTGERLQSASMANSFWMAFHLSPR